MTTELPPEVAPLEQRRETHRRLLRYALDARLGRPPAQQVPYQPRPEVRDVDMEVTVRDEMDVQLSTAGAGQYLESICREALHRHVRNTLNAGHEFETVMSRCDDLMNGPFVSAPVEQLEQGSDTAKAIESFIALAILADVVAGGYTDPLLPWAE